ncbi:MAG TPA: acyl-CoA carboxylase epsilon subunit [Trebonia sp.]|nr:acyl-CoA carboxylase epsilon subunit [Trebonia sp.]
MTTASTGAVITLTRGQPSSGELAAILAVLLALRAGRGASGAAGTPGVPSTASGWTDRSRAMPTPLAVAALPRPGPHAWRASARPR